jgi:hypothetical protein
VRYISNQLTRPQHRHRHRNAQLHQQLLHLPDRSGKNAQHDFLAWKSPYMSGAQADSLHNCAIQRSVAIRALQRTVERLGKVYDRLKAMVESLLVNLEV